MELDLPKIRNAFSMNNRIKAIRSFFDTIPDHRTGKISITMGDALMSAYAMFSLKDPSLLAFQDRQENPSNNFRSLFGIQVVPSDTQFREILDPVDPDLIRPMYLDAFRQLQRGKILERFRYLDGHYLLSLDGTGYFSSNKIHCSSCLEKIHKNGNVTYSHQMLGAVLLHPALKEVIPLAPEPIIRQDGQNKNDCERNSARRFLKRFREEHPHLPVIVLEDSLASNSPHIDDLRNANAHYILGVKKGDHAFLFEKLAAAEIANQTQVLTLVESETSILHHFRFYNSIPLNASNTHQLVNVLEYWEIQPDKIVKGKKREGAITHFSWVTDFKLSEKNVYEVMRGGRSRWKIENEVFNTLKNQGYNLEHNYGHGKKNLSVLLAMIMMLAFLEDQIQQLCSPLFQAAWEKIGSKRGLWEKMRYLFAAYHFMSMQELFEAMVIGLILQRPVFAANSS